MANADLFTIDSKSAGPRIVLAAAVIAALLFGWVAVRRQFGDMIAELTLPNDPNAAAMAEIARGMAPSDPLTMWLSATLEKNVFTPEKTDSAVKMFEETVRLSPRDFRWWIELGRAYEQSGKPELAEAALKQAVAIAPMYTFPRWQIGNFYLRQGREEAAFAELRKATENNQTYREQVFSLAWEYFDKDTAKLEQLAADRPDVHAGLALFYGQRGLAADSLRIWNLLTDEQKSDYPQIFRALAQGLYDRRFFPQALAFTQQLGMDTDAKPEAVSNPGFEGPVGSSGETRFGWIVTRGDGKIEISSDSGIHHEGSKSLRVVFKTYTKPELFNIYQTVVVEPGKAYKLSFWVKTDNLRSSGLPQLQIVNANDDKIITLTPPFPAGSNDWQQINVEFTAPGSCTGVYIRTGRAFCGDNCPLVGTFWYDEFELKRLN